MDLKDVLVCAYLRVLFRQWWNAFSVFNRLRHCVTVNDNYSGYLVSMISILRRQTSHWNYRPYHGSDNLHHD